MSTAIFDARYQVRKVLQEYMRINVPVLTNIFSNQLMPFKVELNEKDILLHVENEVILSESDAMVITGLYFKIIPIAIEYKKYGDKGLPELHIKLEKGNTIDKQATFEIQGATEDFWNKKVFRPTEIKSTEKEIEIIVILDKNEDIPPLEANENEILKIITDYNQKNRGLNGRKIIKEIRKNEESTIIVCDIDKDFTLKTDLELHAEKTLLHYNIRINAGILERIYQKRFDSSQELQSMLQFNIISDSNTYNGTAINGNSRYDVTETYNLEVNAFIPIAKDEQTFNDENYGAVNALDYDIEIKNLLYKTLQGLNLSKVFGRGAKELILIGTQKGRINDLFIQHNYTFQFSVNRFIEFTQLQNSFDWVSDVEIEIYPIV